MVESSKHTPSLSSKLVYSLPMSLAIPEVVFELAVLITEMHWVMHAGRGDARWRCVRRLPDERDDVMEVFRQSDVRSDMSWWSPLTYISRKRRSSTSMWRSSESLWKETIIINTVSSSFTLFLMLQTNLNETFLMYQVCPSLEMS